MVSIQLKTELASEDPHESEDVSHTLQHIWSNEADIALRTKTMKDLEENLRLDAESETDDKKVKSLLDNVDIEMEPRSASINSICATVFQTDNNNPHCSKTDSISNIIENVDEISNSDIGSTNSTSGVPNKTCPVCGYIAHSKTILTNHLYVHSNIKRFKCMKCDKAYKIKGTLEWHILKHHKSEFEDVSQVLTQKIVKCSVCDFEAVGMKLLKRHYLKVHEGYTGAKKFKCDQCNYQSQKRSNVVHHQLSHTGVKLYHCSFCQKGYNVKVQLENHILRYHKPQCGDNLEKIVTHKILSCEKCPFETVDSLSFKKHVLIHGGEYTKDLELLKCGNCSFTTYNKKKLVCHVQKHLKTKFFSCSECEKSYTSKVCLDFHVVKCHVSKKPKLLETITTKIHRCDKCLEIFRKFIELEKHQRKSCV